MRMPRRSLIASGLAMAALVAVMSMSGPAAFAQQSPFAAMLGSWSGGGTIALSNGTRERIRCRANYRGEAVNLALELRCASDSYKFELSSNVVSNGGNLSGNWTEATRGASGSISGTINRGQIHARASSPVFTAMLAMNTQGSRQSISIQSPGSELQSVSISMNRGGR